MKGPESRYWKRELQDRMLQDLEERARKGAYLLMSLYNVKLMTRIFYFDLHKSLSTLRHRSGMVYFL